MSHPLSVSTVEARAEEIHQAIARNDGARALTQLLLDLAKDFGSRADLHAALVLSNRFNDVSQRLLIIGSHSNAQAERAEILMAALQLTAQVVDLQRAGLLAGNEAAERESAKNAFTAGSTRRVQASSNDVVLVVDRLKLVRRERIPRFALQDVSFELKEGEILALVGANGQGKSTLLEVVSGRLARHGGDLRYPFSEPEWSVIKRDIAYMPQSVNMTVDVSEIALRYVAALYGSLDDDNDLVIDYTLERLGITKFRGVPSRQLSRGYQVRFGLARALLKRPRLLLLDEPLAHLDIPTQSRFLGDLRDLSRSATNPFAAIISSQHLHEIESIADKTLVLRDGRPEYCGPTADVGARRREEVYELLTDRSAEEIGRILRRLGTCHVERSGPNTLVRLPRGRDPASVLQCLLASGARVSYFRDLSGSARTYLQGSP